MFQDAEEKEVSTEEFHMVRSKVFNFHSMLSVIIVNLKIRTNQRTEICKYWIDGLSDGNLMASEYSK